MGLIERVYSLDSVAELVRLELPGGDAEVIAQQIRPALIEFAAAQSEPVTSAGAMVVQDIIDREACRLARELE